MIRDSNDQQFSKRILDWLTLVGGIATALAAIIGVYMPGDDAKRVAFPIAILLGLASAAVFYFQRRRADRLAIPPVIQPEMASAALRGLLPFEEGDALPGRGRDSQELYTLAASSTFRFGVVWGESGCGKTSLMRAGLVPTLRKNGFLPLYIPKPTQDPQQAIGRALQKETGNSPQGQDLKERLIAAAPKGKKVIVLLDQFEEFFLTNPSLGARAGFVKWLGDMVADESLPVCFLVGIRADFFAQLQNLAPLVPEPTSPRTTYQLQNFDREQAKQVFSMAARADAIPFEAGLIEGVVSDLETEGVVRPAELQVVGTRLKRRNVFTLNKYEIAGRARGILSSYISEEIKQSGNETAARLVLRLMTTDTVETKSPTDLTIDDIERGVGRAGMTRSAGTQPPDEIRSILNQFVAARIVIRTDDDKYNLVHDYLAPYVRTATEGVETDVERANRLLKRAMAEYAEDPHTLVQFRRWREIRKNASADVKNSEKARELMRKSAWAFLLRYGTEIVAIAVFALLLSFIARDQANKALSLQLATKSSTLLSGDPELSVLLAAEALQRYPSSEAENALRRALAESKVSFSTFPSQGLVASAAFSPDPNRNEMVTASGDGRARMWDLTSGKLICETVGHTPGIMHVAFSPDGRFFVTASQDKTARVWDTKCKNISVLSGHTDTVWNAHFFTNRFVVTASYDKTARVWEAASGRMLYVLDGHTSGVHDAEFSPDGKLIVTVSIDDRQLEQDDETVRLWETGTGKLVRELRGHTAGVWNAAFSQDGKWVVTASRDGTARIWEVASGNSVAVLQGHTEDVIYAEFSRDGQRLVTASFDNTARVWDTSTWQVISILRGHSRSLNRAEFSRDGRFVVTASWDGTARVWDAATGQVLRVLAGHTGLLWTATFSPDARFVVTGSQDTTARVWDSGIKQSVVDFEGHQQAVNSASFNSDGKLVLTASRDNTARVWDAATGKVVKALEGHTAEVNNARFSADSKFVVTASEDNTARVWDLNRDKVVILGSHDRGVRDAIFSHDGRYVLSLSRNAGGEGLAHIWEASTGKLLNTLVGTPGGMTSGDFSPDDLVVVTASGNTAQVWDVISGKNLENLSGHTGPVNSVVFSPDGKFIVTASNDKTARVWDWSTGKSVAIFDEQYNFVNTAVFSADGHLVLTASVGNGGRIWDISNPGVARLLPGHTNEVTGAQFSRDSKWVVTASKDNTARIWQASTGDSLMVLSGHSAPVNTAVFSPDGKLVLTASDDTTAKIFACEVCASPSDLLVLARKQVKRTLTAEERAEFFR